MPDRPPSPTKRALQLPATIARRWYHGGLAHTAQWFSYQLSWRYREWKLGVKTGAFDHGFVVGDDGDHLGYEPIDPRCFEIILDHLTIRAGRDVFLDLGCGKGRALLLAARRPFRTVIGVERAASLCAIADKHMRLAKPQLRCRDIAIVQVDAAAYEVPTDVTVVFMFRPFKGKVLLAALEQIRRSLVAAPRDLTVIHVLPAWEPDLLAECRWLRKECLLPAGFWTHVKSLVYKADTAAATREQALPVERE